MNINCVQQLMVSRGPKSGVVECIADGFLKFPQLIWQGIMALKHTEEDVKLVPEGHLRSYTKCLADISYSRQIPSNYDEEGDERPMCFILCCSPCYLTSALVAAPLLGVGLTLKKISIEIDPTAKKYNELAAFLLEEQNILSSIEDNKNKIEIGKKILERYSISSEIEVKIDERTHLRTIKTPLPDFSIGYENKKKKVEESYPNLIKKDNERLEEVKEAIIRAKAVYFSS